MEICWQNKIIPWTDCEFHQPKEWDHFEICTCLLRNDQPKECQDCKIISRSKRAPDWPYASPHGQSQILNLFISRSLVMASQLPQTLQRIFLSSSGKPNKPHAMYEMFTCEAYFLTMYLGFFLWQHLPFSQQPWSRWRPPTAFSSRSCAEPLLRTSIPRCTQTANVWAPKKDRIW